VSTKDFSNKQESMVASFLDWSRVAGSGAATCKAGDVISSKFLGECKTHETPGSKVTFRQDVWLKICDEAMVFSRIPVLIADDGTQQWRRTYCLLKPLPDMSVLPKNEFFVSQYKVGYKKQLNFDADKIYAKMKKHDCCIYTVEWFDGTMLLMNLETFREFQQYV
jgi:hypothetical protein